MNRRQIQRTAVLVLLIGVLWHAADFSRSFPWVLLILFPSWAVGAAVVGGLGEWRVRAGRRRAQEAGDLSDHVQFYLENDRLRWRSLQTAPESSPAELWLDVGIAGLSAGIVLSFQAGFIGPVETTVRAGVFGWSLLVVAGLLLALAAVYRRRVLLPEMIGLGADVLDSIEAPLTDCARHFDTVMADLRRTQRQTARLRDLELDHQLRRFAQELRTGAWMECLYEKRWSDCHAVLDVCEEELARFNRRAGEQFHEPPPQDNAGDEDYAPMTLELAYEILKARPGCSAGDLERIIKNLRRAYHPDLFTGPAEKRHYDRLLARVNQAYQFILDHGV